MKAILETTSTMGQERLHTLEKISYSMVSSIMVSHPRLVNWSQQMEALYTSVSLRISKSMDVVFSQTIDQTEDMKENSKMTQQWERVASFSRTAMFTPEKQTKCRDKEQVECNTKMKRANHSSVNLTKTKRKASDSTTYQIIASTVVNLEGMLKREQVNTSSKKTSKTISKMSILRKSRPFWIKFINSVENYSPQEWPTTVPRLQLISENL